MVNNIKLKEVLESKVKVTEEGRELLEKYQPSDIIVRDKIQELIDYANTTSNPEDTLASIFTELKVLVGKVDMQLQ